MLRVYKIQSFQNIEYFSGSWFCSICQINAEMCYQVSHQEYQLEEKLILKTKSVVSKKSINLQLYI